MQKGAPYLFVLPVRNEAAILDRAVVTLHRHLQANWEDDSWLIVIANNGSTDVTGVVAEDLARTYPGKVEHLEIAAPGRGGALREVVRQYPHQFLLYSDIDLPVPLETLPAFFAPLREGRG